jgi:hypothetical protein
LAASGRKSTHQRYNLGNQRGMPAWLLLLRMIA